MILKCKCKSEYQDQKLGKGNRIHNETKKLNEYRCTVCASMNKPSDEIKIKEKK